MSYFVIDGVLECGRQYELKGEEAGHILKSRRLRIGDHFLIQDEQGQRFEVVLKNFSRNSLKFIPEKTVSVPLPSPLRLEVLLALPKEKALDFVLQKTTELGVNRLDLFGGVHSSKVSRTSLTERKMTRWNRIALEASKQCGRQSSPEIYWHPNLEETLSTVPECPNSWVLSPGISNSVSWKNTGAAVVKPKDHQRVLVGPEGGFHPVEIDLALRAGLCPVDFGPRILRSETAAVSAVAILQFLWGDLTRKKNMV